VKEDLNLKRLLPIVVLVMLVAAGAGSLWWRSTEPRLSRDDLALRTSSLTHSSEVEQDIYEAVFRYELAERGYKGNFTLWINRDHPSDDFMSRFKDCGNIIRKASESHGESTVSLFVNGINWMSPDYAEVYGGSACGPLCLESGLYRLIRQKRKWKVEQYRPGLMSQKRLIETYHC
jgi:hypothetical protein